MRNTWSILLLAAACGGRSEIGGVTGDLDGSVLPSEGGTDGAVACKDEVIASGCSATALASDGDRVAWGTVNGELWLREGGNTSQHAKEPATVQGIALDGKTTYFSSSESVFADSMGVVSVVAATQGDPWFVAADSQAVYHMDLNPQRVVRVDKTSKAAQVLLSGFGRGFGMAIDDTSVYVSGGVPLHGFIGRIPKTGGPMQHLADDLATPSRIALSATRVFFLESGRNGVRSVAKTGGPITNLGDMPADQRLGGLTVDATSVYVTTFSPDQPSPQPSLVRRISLDGSKNEEWVTGPYGAIFLEVSNDANAVYWTSHLNNAAPCVLKKCK